MKKASNSYCHMYEWECSCQLLIGKNQNGNDYIIKNASRMMDGISTYDLIWIHPKNTSGCHAIYNQCPKSTCINTSNSISDVIKTHINGAPNLTCCRLSQIKCTNIMGRVTMGAEHSLDELFISH
jgi:hypothetical protein